MWSAAGMANVSSEDKRQQVLGLGRLGWSLRRIESATGVRWETACGYLRAAGNRRARARREPVGVAAKTGHRGGGVHRLFLGEFGRSEFKTGHHGGGVHRPSGQPSADSQRV
jgi:hypothetical protein